MSVSCGAHVWLQTYSQVTSMVLEVAGAFAVVPYLGAMSSSLTHAALIHTGPRAVSAVVYTLFPPVIGSLSRINK